MTEMEDAIDQLDLAFRKIIRLCDRETHCDIGPYITCQHCGGKGEIPGPIFTACPKCKDSEFKGLVLYDPYKYALGHAKAIMARFKADLKNHKTHDHQWTYVNDDEQHGACYCSICGVSGDI